jgi:hypothetical protein
MNKRSWWKAAAAVVVGGAGIALADSPKLEQAVWTRSSAPVATPAAPAVVPASASVPAAKPAAPAPSLPSYPLPPKTSSDSVVMPEFRAAPPMSAPPVKLPPAAVSPVASLPPIVSPPTTTTNKVPVQPPIPAAVPDVPKAEPAPALVPKVEAAPAVIPKATPAPSLPMLPPPPSKVQEQPKLPMLPPPPKVEVQPSLPQLPPPPKVEPKASIPVALPTPPKVEPKVNVPAIPPIKDAVGGLPSLPPPPEIAPPAQPAKSAQTVKPLPPAIPDFNLRPAPSGNSVNSNGPSIPMAPPEPEAKAFARPKSDAMPPTDKYVFPIPVKAPVASTGPKPIPATLPTSDMPEAPAVPPRELPGVIPPVPMILPGVPTSLEKPKPEPTTIPTPGADPMNLKQTTMAAALGTALALSPLTASAQPGATKTTDEKLVEAQKEIKRLAELLEGRKDTDGKTSPVDVGAVEEVKRLKDDVFRLKEKVNSLQNQLDEMKKATTSLKPAPVDPMAGKGTVRVENDYQIEITIVVNTMSYRVPAGTKLDIPVPAGDFTYQLLNSGTSLAPVKSPIKEKEIVKLRIK